MSARPTGEGVREVRVALDDVRVTDWVRLEYQDGSEHVIQVSGKAANAVSAYHGSPRWYTMREVVAMHVLRPAPPKLPTVPGSVIRVTTGSTVFTVVRLADGWTRADNSVQARSGWETRIANAYARDGQWRIEVLYNAGGAA